MSSKLKIAYNPEREKNNPEKSARGAGGTPRPDTKQVYRGWFSCGSMGHRKANCPYNSRKMALKAPNTLGDSLSAPVKTQEGFTAQSKLRPVTPDAIGTGVCISAILDAGAEVTVKRESRVPLGLIKSHAAIELVSAFGQKVQAKLAVMPLMIKHDLGSVLETSEVVPVACTLTDILVAKTDCFL
ncbi:hypothetical protein HPB48_000105 [Haemaphysalis longicornis]|uniref:Uncharacterized protein n=1 Tax=Haemaphysalis longicornis TaxID=44386 RepID=A0A9J6FPS6_HAELO|nr:hypothetical protein HPB48_000105 [Haemaphysalis longicornis]